MIGQREAAIRCTTKLCTLLAATTGKALLMIGVAALALASAQVGTAQAKQSETVKKPAAAAAPVVDDGLGPHDIYMEADTVVDDKDKNLVTLEGHVEMRYQGRTLRADTVTYNSVTGVTHAVGHVVIVSADGTSEFSTDTLLDDQFRSAVAMSFSGRMQDNVTMVAGASIKRSETITELNHGMYTPCAICEKDGKTPKKPSWSIEATRIIEDRDRRVIYYRNAVIRILGVPIFYSPIFWHPDPTAPRQSGFLAPKITYSSKRGLSYSQPYYVDLSPSADLILTPQLDSRVDPFLSARFREQFYSGYMDIRLGYTYGKEFDNHEFFGDATSRSFILGKGAFQLDPKWTVGFGLERVTDPTLFQRYSISQIYTDRGPFPTDTDRLISQVYANRQTNHSYLSMAALSFESLRAAVLDNGVSPAGIESFDTSAAFPTATPIEGLYDPQTSILGGRLRLTGDALTLTRNNPVIDITDPLGLTSAGPQPYSYHGLVETQLPSTSTADPTTALVYRDSRSAHGEANWQSSLTFSSGLRVQPFADARVDYFSINRGELYQLAGNTPALNPADSSESRELGSVGTNLSWPLIKPIGKGSLIIEPLVQVIFANRLKYDKNIPNEDSVSFEYDETNLFELNRFSGYDLAEGGARANLGLRASLDLANGRNASLIIGRTYRSQSDLEFTPQSGLQGRSSDWVTAVSVTPIPGFSVFNRARLDGQDWTVHREEAGMNFGYGRLSAAVRYVYEQSGIVQVDCTIQEITLSANGTQECPSPFGGALVPTGSSVIGAVENLDINGSWFFLPTWGVTINASHDFVGFETNGRYKPVWPEAQFGLTYLDECIRVDLIYTHQEYYSATIGPSNSIAFRLTLTTLGGTIGAPATTRQGSR